VSDRKRRDDEQVGGSVDDMLHDSWKLVFVGLSNRKKIALLCHLKVQIKIRDGCNYTNLWK
jgi:hypothetical protein